MTKTVTALIAAHNEQNYIEGCLNSLIEQTAKPIVIVPNPEWTRTAGTKDAVFLAEKANAILVSEITPENLLNTIERAKKRIVPDFMSGAENLAGQIANLVGSQT